MIGDGVRKELFEQSRKTQRLFDIVMGTIAGISLLVGGIGIMNIMLSRVVQEIRRWAGNPGRGRNVIEAMRRKALPSLLVVLALGAQPGRASADDERERTPLPRTSHFAVLAGYGGPLGATAGIELLVGPGAEVWTESEGFRGLAGVRVQLHGGPHGAKLGVGLGLQADVKSEDFSGPVAVGLQAAVVHGYWEGGRYGTYTGPELDLSLLHVQTSLGLLLRIHGQGSGRVLFTWGLGVRF